MATRTSDWREYSFYGARHNLRCIAIFLCASPASLIFCTTLGSSLAGGYGPAPFAFPGLRGRSQPISTEE